MSEKTDPLYHWKRHSGFKKGLLTDIVFGDEATPQTIYQTTTNSQFQTKNKIDEQRFAGRSSGFTISDKGQKHIFFGDSSISPNNESVTRSDFKETIVNGVDKKNNKQGILAYHTKPENNTSAAHVGQQTKQDLPIDMIHFKNFETTTNDSYRVKNTPTEKRIIYGARPSGLDFGDQGKGHYYETTQANSYINHDIKQPIFKSKRNDKKSTIFNTTIAKEDIEDIYSTTLSQAYKGVQVEKVIAKVIPKESSHIQFGVPVSKTQTSVTKSDYTDNHNSAFIEKPQKANYYPGMKSSIKPGETGPFESMNNSVYKAKKKFERNAAGKTNGLEVTDEISSVPTGDLKCYNLAFANSINQESYIDYNGEGFQNRVRLGQNYRKTQIFNSTNDKDYTPEYKTSNNSDYQQFTAEEMRLTRQPRIDPYRPSHRLGYDLEGFKDTTQHSHYVKIEADCMRHPKLPSLADRNKLFPIKLGNDFGKTIYSGEFAMRDGLLKKTKVLV